MPARYGSTGIFYLLVLSGIGTPKKRKGEDLAGVVSGVDSSRPGILGEEGTRQNRRLFTDNLRWKQQGIQEKW